MKDLIERLEKATEGSRELDADIALAISYVTERDGNLFFGNKDYTTLVLERDYYDHGGAAPELPHYTTSLDAAMMLVPEGGMWWVEHTEDGKSGALIFTAGAWSESSPEDCCIGDSYKGATPALALCIAALRARDA